jgi:hypothetical protein
MKERFKGRIETFRSVSAFSIDIGRGEQSPWVLVAHPLWNWDDVEPPHGILAEACAEALKDSSGAPQCWDTFNLERRQVMVRERIRQVSLGHG